MVLVPDTIVHLQFSIALNMQTWQLDTLALLPTDSDGPFGARNAYTYGLVKHT